MALLLVGAGGFVGAILRYLATGWVYQALNKPWFPYGTLAVNLIGCFVIGFLGGIAEERRFFSQEVRLFVFVGLLGGFTTYSSFGFETSMLIRDARLLGASLNVGIHIIAGLAAVWLGSLSARLF